MPTVLRLALTSLITLAAIACEQPLVPTPVVDPAAATADATVQLVASSLEGRPGQRITVALDVRVEAGEALGGIQGMVRFDPSRLRYVGVAPEPARLMMVNGNSADDGELRFLTVGYTGLEGVVSPLVFEVLAGGDPGLALSVDVAGSIDASELAVDVVEGVKARAGLASPEGARGAMSAEVWAAHLGFRAPDPSDGPAPVSALEDRPMGDCRPDYAINVLDGLDAARISVGLDPVPALPWLFRLCDVLNNGDINVLDVLETSSFSTGQPLPGGTITGFPLDPLLVTSNRTCSISDTGEASCWGWNDEGQLGDGTTIPRDVPTPVSGGHDFHQLDGGWKHTCGVTTGGELYCWGRGDEGQLGNGGNADSSTPVGVAGSGYAQVVAGFNHACSLDETGVARCWGLNDRGQLGNGTTSNSASPVSVLGGLTFIRLVAGSYHTCGIDTAGLAHCWGWNQFSTLGDGGTANQTVPVPVAGGMTFTQLGAGYSHTCGLDTANEAFCWGDNSDGKLGDGTEVARSTPVAVMGGISWKVLELGESHTCGLDQSGVALCWGHNTFGRLGDGTISNISLGIDNDRLIPTPVVTTERFLSIGGGQYHTCALAGDGESWCWGANYQGQLGDDQAQYQHAPVPVVGGINFDGVQTGATHTCGVSSTGIPYCWGSNGSGELGVGTTGEGSHLPAAVPGLSDIRAVDVGWGFSCALDAVGQAWCWGENSYGQLGTGTAGAEQTSPVAVTGGQVFVQISGGFGHTCGLDVSGVAWCWGRNDEGQLGIGSTTQFAAPVAVAGGHQFVHIVAGEVHTCAIDDMSQAWCWGDNSGGQLGDGTTLTRTMPTAVASSVTFAQISGGYLHTCGVAAGTLYCWGDNSIGQFGNGSTTGSFVPVGVSSGIRQVSAAGAHTCAVSDAGVASCWGSGNSGELGDGLATASTLPVEPTVQPQWRSLSLGGWGSSFTCGVANNGQAWCWGNNLSGQLGVPVTNLSALPVRTVGLP